MPVPKSVVKINKNGVEYVSSVDKANYYIFELTRAALRDVGKLCCRRFRDSYYQHFKRRTRRAGKSLSYNVWSNKRTLYPRVQIGIKQRAKGFYSLFEEFGSSKTQKLGLLRKAVEGNIAEIIRIESQYLSAIEQEERARQLINEAEISGDADG